MPNRLKGKQVYSLDLGQLVVLSSAGNSTIVCAWSLYPAFRAAASQAGTKYRGEFEDRLDPNMRRSS